MLNDVIFHIAQYIFSTNTYGNKTLYNIESFISVHTF